MLTEIELENFKAFGPRVSLPLAPVTLLFGGNSAGKSSVFHALHLAREVLTRGNLDPDRTEMGGGSLDLGGFANLVHRHDLDRAVRLGFTVRDLGWTEAPAFEDDAQFALTHPEATEEADESDVPFHHEGDDATRVVFEIRWSRADARARVTAFEIARGDQGHPALRIESTLDGRDVRITAVEAWQFRPDPEQPTNGHPEVYAVLDRLQGTARSDDQPWSIAVYDQEQALPVRGRPLRLWTDADPWREDTAVRAFARQVSRWVLGALDGLRDELAGMLHLGPVRTLPARLFEPPRSPAPWRWHTGLGAWDMLHHADETFVESVNRWLAGDDGLGTRCMLQQRDVVELDQDTWDRLQALALDGQDLDALRTLLSGHAPRRRLKVYDEVHRVEVAPRDLGVGIVQVLPVVVAALQPRYGLVGLEQPELHVHPRAAVGLGDLLAENRRRDGNAGGKHFLVETHSEHLLLRLMRRVRETHEGTLAPDDPRALAPQDLAVLHFDLGHDGETEVRRLRLDDYGTFLDVWPQGFFEERLKEMLGP